MKQHATILPYPTTPTEAAAKWITRIHAEDCTPEDRADLDRWLSASPANRAAFDELARVWKLPAQLAGHAEIFAKLSAQADAADARKRALSWRYAMAAGLACLAVAVTWIGMRGSMPDAQTASTVVAPQTLTFPDGSNVVLGAKTVVSLNYSATERRVTMRGGEAFFDVSKDAVRPFVVRVGNSEIRVLGTQFNVRQSASELEVVVREGKVNVIPDARGGELASAPRVEVTPGNRLRVTAGANEVSVAQVNVERLTAWRTGMMKFDAVPLGEVIEDVNRHADKPLVIANESIRALTVSGRFRVGDTEGVQFLLKERFGVAIDVEAERVLLR